MSYDYPEIGEAIAIHDALIHEFGGAPDLRDEGAAGRSNVSLVVLIQLSRD